MRDANKAQPEEGLDHALRQHMASSDPLIESGAVAPAVAAPRSRPEIHSDRTAHRIPSRSKRTSRWAQHSLPPKRRVLPSQGTRPRASAVAPPPCPSSPGSSAAASTETTVGPEPSAALRSACHSADGGDDCQCPRRSVRTVGEHLFVRLGPSSNRRRCSLRLSTRSGLPTARRVR